MKEVLNVLAALYSTDALKTIESNLGKLEHNSLDTYKTTQHPLQIYVTYPNSFFKKEVGNLYTLAESLPYIQSLGINAVHVLPPFASPMIDGGFDVSDFYTIREELGGNEAFDTFLASAKTEGLLVFIDFVLNHISDQHEWFQKAISGDHYYQSFFYTLGTKPDLLNILSTNEGTFATYLIDGKQYAIRVIFPDQAGPIPHWVEHNGLWYYHTFYPQQLDLNWHNPDIFLEMAKVLQYWSDKGCHFRLDAVPYIGKSWGEGMQPGTNTTHTLLRALYLLANTARQTVFLPEISAKSETLQSYLNRDGNKQADFVYHFELTESIWEALLLKNTRRLWQTILQTPTYQPPESWITFLRNHDSLTLKFTDEPTRTNLINLLTLKGLTFREGNAVSGRTASFLDNDPTKILIAHFLLASLPGNPAMMYGDELGKSNDVTFMKTQTQDKLDKGQHVTDDTRDINRGIITENYLHNSQAMYIHEQIAKIFTTRKSFASISHVLPTLIGSSSPALFSGMYELPQGLLRVFVNLSDQKFHISSHQGENVLTVGTYQPEDASLEAYSGVWLYEQAT